MFANFSASARVCEPVYQGLEGHFRGQEIDHLARERYGTTDLLGVPARPLPLKSRLKDLLGWLRNAAGMSRKMIFERFKNRAFRCVLRSF